MNKNSAMAFDGELLAKAVVAVGEGARGFVMERTFHVGQEKCTERLIVTAAHCLPHLPSAKHWLFAEDKTYPSILGVLGNETLTITAECIFVDPIADLAVLGEPDGQKLPMEWEAFNLFVDTAETVQLSVRTSTEEIQGWLLSKSGKWESCRVVSHGQTSLIITEVSGGIHGGMSGSPILTSNGAAIGVLSKSFGSPGKLNIDGPQPHLARCLPWWLVEQLSSKN